MIRSMTLTLLLSCALSCSGNPDAGTQPHDSNTNWLSACSGNQDCDSRSTCGTSVCVPVPNQRPAVTSDTELMSDAGISRPATSACLDSCTAQPDDESTCRARCAEAEAIVEATCYDDCTAGGDDSFCRERCSSAEDSASCLTECTAGTDSATCTERCTSVHCYGRCLASGGTEERCRPRCADSVSSDSCEDDCTGGGAPNASCSRMCSASNDAR